MQHISPTRFDSSLPLIRCVFFKYANDIIPLVVQSIQINDILSKCQYSKSFIIVLFVIDWVGGRVNGWVGGWALCRLVFGDVSQLSFSDCKNFHRNTLALYLSVCWCVCVYVYVWMGSSFDLSMPWILRFPIPFGRTAQRPIMTYPIARGNASTWSIRCFSLARPEVNTKSFAA